MLNKKDGNDPEKIEIDRHAVGNHVNNEDNVGKKKINYLGEDSSNNEDTTGKIDFGDEGGRGDEGGASRGKRTGKKIPREEGDKKKNRIRDIASGIRRNSHDNGKGKGHDEHLSRRI